MLKPVTEYKCDTLQTERIPLHFNMSKFSGSFHKTAEVLFCHKKKSMKLRTYLFLYILPHQLQHGQQDWKHFTSIHIDKLRTYLFLYILPHQAQHEQQDLEAFHWHPCQEDKQESANMMGTKSIIGFTEDPAALK